MRFRALLSWLWPMPVDRFTTLHGPMEVRYEGGALVLNSERGNQSFGSLHRVWQDVFQRIGLKSSPPNNVLMLGLGGGSVVRILREELRLPCPITAVELDPAMIAAGNRHFGLSQVGGLQVIQGDAMVQIHALRERFDLVVVDLFDDLDLARGADTLGFAHALRDRCQGTLCFNTVGHDAASWARCERVAVNLRKVFVTVDELRLEGVNRVFIAR